MIALATETSFDLSKGSITIETDVIAKIAGYIATSCYGVVGMAYRSKTDEFANLLKKDNLTKGIKVTATDKKVTLDMHIIAEYGTNITVVCNSVINSVKYQVNKLTGLEVGEVNVFVEGFRVQE
jgi:uncharacterized alkaline shock family protein YloU